MSTDQAERAISQLYESDSLRSELRDEEASLLLMWGEVRLKEMADRDMADDEFDHLSEKFRSLLAAINVCVGKRKTSPSQHLPMMANISSAAEAAGLMLTPDDQTTFLKQQSALTNQDAISELLGLLKPSDSTTPTSQMISQAAAESVVPATAPVAVETPQAQALAEPQPSSQSVTEVAAEHITAQAVPQNTEALITEPVIPAPTVVEGHQPAQPEDLPRPESSTQNLGEPAPIIIPQTSADHIQAPQPEELPALQNVGEAPVEPVTSQPAPPVVDNLQPTQPEDLPRPEPTSQMVDEATQIVTSQPTPIVVEETKPQQPEDLPRPEQPSQNEGESRAESIPSQPQSEVVPEPQQPILNIGEAAEIITPQPPPAMIDNTQPPQPEDLPEFPKPPPPQEGTHDV